MHDQALYNRLVDSTYIDNDGCWMWTKYVSRHSKSKAGHRGYASIGRRTQYAHRAMYIAVHGPIPKGMCVCHACDKPSCIRPDHLWLGTVADNMADKKAKGRHHNSQKTECKRGHPFAGTNIKWSMKPDGTWVRRCRECLRLDSIERRRRAKIDRQPKEIRMTYQVPPKPADPKPRYVIVTDPLEIAAMQRADLRDPIGAIATDGTAYAEWHSLRQFRGQPVEFNP